VDARGFPRFAAFRSTSWLAPLVLLVRRNVPSGYIAGKLLTAPTTVSLFPFLRS
jgi:hypothetical protein